MLIESTIQISTLIFIANQFNLSKKDYKVKNEIFMKREAVSLAKYYQEEILSIAYSFSNAYQVSKHANIISCIKEANMKEFTIDELIKNLNNENEDPNDAIEKWNSIHTDPEFIYQLHSNLSSSIPTKHNRDMFDFILIRDQRNRYIKDLEKVKDDKEKKDLEKIIQKMHIDLASKLGINFNIILDNLADTYYSDLLNKLEHFSMNFVTGVADEYTVYSSLQHSFRAIVKNSYIHISKINDKTTEKYYNNIIELYNTWNDRYLNDKKKEDELKREHQKKIDELSQKEQEYLDEYHRNKKGINHKQKKTSY